jgi:hypothetical protein
MSRFAWMLGLALAACASRARFAPLPSGLPDVSRWETSSGSVDFPNPPTRLEYQLYVAPARPAFYSVTRYRFTPKAATEVAHEKLQWDRNGTDVRRYECVPENKSRALPCRWEELPRGSAAYIGELVPLLSVYDTHAKLLRLREAGR